MVKSSTPQILFAKRNRLFQLLAVFLLVYAVADVTILEYYCGNESLGISSYNQVLADDADNQELSAVDETVFALNAAGHSAPDKTPESPAQHDECLCACGHLLMVDYRVESYQEPISYKQKHLSVTKFFHTNSHPPNTFRPPRTA